MSHSFANDNVFGTGANYVNFEYSSQNVQSGFYPNTGRAPTTYIPSGGYIGAMAQPTYSQDFVGGGGLGNQAMRHIPIRLSQRQPLISSGKSSFLTSGRGPIGAKKKAAGGQRSERTAPSVTPDPNAIPYTLDAKNVVCFFGRNHFLSPLYSSQFEVGAHRYYSVEHYYEAVKLFSLLGPAAAMQLQNVKDPAAAKSVSRRLISDGRIDRKTVDKWRSGDAVKVIMHALNLKFAPGTELAQKLIATGTTLLVQTNPHDDLWAVNLGEKEFMEWMIMNDKTVIRLPPEINAGNVKSMPLLGRKGKNLLGFLLMEVRRKLQGEQNPTGSSVQQMPTIAEETADREGAAACTSSAATAAVSAADEKRYDEIGKRLAEMAALQEFKAASTAGQ